MSLSCPRAGITAFAEFMTGVGTPLINSTGHLLANASREGGTAGGHVIGAAHAPGVGVDLHRQAAGHMSTRVIQFVCREVNPERRATRPAGLAS